MLKDFALAFVAVLIVSAASFAVLIVAAGLLLRSY